MIIHLASIIVLKKKYQKAYAKSLSCSGGHLRFQIHIKKENFVKDHSIIHIYCLGSTKCLVIHQFSYQVIC